MRVVRLALPYDYLPHGARVMTLKYDQTYYAIVMHPNLGKHPAIYHTSKYSHIGSRCVVDSWKLLHYQKPEISTMIRAVLDVYESKQLRMQVVVSTDYLARGGLLQPQSTLNRVVQAYLDEGGYGTRFRCCSDVKCVAQQYGNIAYHKVRALLPVSG